MLDCKTPPPSLWPSYRFSFNCPFTLWPYYTYSSCISVLMVICPTKFCKSDVILAETTSSNSFSSNSPTWSITFSLWASTAVTSSWRTRSALTGPVACDNGSGLSHPIPHVSLGLSALAGAASAGEFLDLDASLGLRCWQGFVFSATNPQLCLSGNTDYY